MTQNVSTGSGRLPAGFEELEPYLDHWGTATSHERWLRRSGTPYPEIVKFYEAIFARAEEATTLLEQYPFDAMPEPAQNLFKLLLAICQAAIAVEMHQAPTIRHAPPQHALKIEVGFQPHG